jgi:ribose 5-phosphate isomerase B
MTESDHDRWIVAVGADGNGLALKDDLVALLRADTRVAEVRDFGVHESSDPTAYPHVGLSVAEAVARGEVDRALLICGTGIGMSISANKVPGVRAATAHDPYSLERSVLSNDCQVLCFGAQIVAPHLARKLLGEWLDYRFDPASASAKKVAVIRDYEERGTSS